MYGRSQQARRSDSRCVFSRFHRISSSIYVLYTSVSSTSLTTRTASQHQFSSSLIQRLTSLFLTAVSQTPPFHSAKRRRLYGLNSRFDRMLQEVGWASNVTKSSLPRFKRVYSPSSSTITNHDLPKTPTDAPNEMVCGSGKLGKSSVSATPENRLSATTLWKSTCLSPSQVVKPGNQVFSNSLYGQLRVGNLYHSRSSWNPLRGYQSG
jgi:hypothetical protein